MYFLITAVQRYYEGQEEVKKAEIALEKSKKERAQALQELKDLLPAEYDD